MDDALIAIFVMRGLERLSITLISAMCLFLAWKLTIKILDHPVGDDLINDDWTKNWKRPLIHLTRVLPAAVLIVIAVWILVLIVQPIKAHISEVRVPAELPSAQSSTKPLANGLNQRREYFYEDSGL